MFLITEMTPPCFSLGTVLEKLLAGLVLQPLRALSHHGLLHLRHVLLRLKHNNNSCRWKQVETGDWSVTASDKRSRTNWVYDSSRSSRRRRRVQTCTFTQRLKERERDRFTRNRAETLTLSLKRFLTFYYQHFLPSNKNNTSETSCSSSKTLWSKKISKTIHTFWHLHMIINMFPTNQTNFWHF